MPDLLERAIAEVNELEPDIVVCSGDLTTFGFKEEYAQAKRYLDRIECEALVVVPGNHDSRNVGYVHFEELFGERNSRAPLGGVTVVAVDSTEPDLDHGQIGRGRYRWIEEQFAAEPAELRDLRAPPPPAADPGHRPRAQRRLRRGRRDRVPAARRRHLVLSGHKHVPYAWRLENLFVVNTGTVSTLRLRGEHAALLQRRSRSTARTSPSGAATRSTGRSGSSSSTSRPASTRSTRAGSSAR